MKIITARKVRLGLTLKVKKPNGAVRICKKRSTRVFLNLIASVPAQNRYFLRVYYGRGETQDSKKGFLVNCGWYDTKKDLLFAFRCFTEKALLKEMKEWVKA